MEVPSAVLEKLVCERCGGFLSRGPVHLLQNTKYRCGRCPWIENADEEEGIRVEAYEELAKLMSFPCAYQKYGCTRKVRFQDNKRHEEVCPFREYSCLVTESGQCDWTGFHTQVLEHCQQAHPTKVLPKNPCTFTCDITRPSFSNYVLFVFNVLFLVQSKVCTETQKIYHAVRLIGDPFRASDFKFTLEIKNKKRKVTKYGNVAPRELLELLEKSSKVTGINSLQQVLGHFKDITFTVTVQSSGQGTSRSSTTQLPVKTLEGIVVCSKCFTLTEAVYRGDWLCRKDGRKQFGCKKKTQGCTYMDIKTKCLKHEWCYCQYATFCSICSKDITGTTLDSHYAQAHGDIAYRAGTVCTVTLVTEKRWLIINCDFGRAICSYWLSDSVFTLDVFTSLSSTQLYKYKCTMDLSHPETGHTLRCTATSVYNREEDWTMCFPLFVYKAYIHNNKLNIKINITKINDPSKVIL